MALQAADVPFYSPQPINTTDPEILWARALWIRLFSDRQSGLDFSPALKIGCQHSGRP